MKISLGALLLAVFFLGAPFRSDGLEIDFTFGTGLMTGVTQELVYEGERLLSRLDWIDRAVPNVDLSARISARNFFLRFGLTSAIPVTIGEMENIDFLDRGSPEITNYSRHNSKLDRDFTLGLEAGYEIPLGLWHMTPSAGVRFRNRKWTGSGGYKQYPESGPWTGNEPRVWFNGPVISYEQTIWFPFLALEIGYEHIFPREDRARFSITGSLYPAVWVEADDVHFLRNTVFHDSMSGGVGWSFALRSEFYPRRANGIGFILDLRTERIANVRGSTSSNNTGILTGPPSISEGHSAGTEVTQWYVSLGVIIPLLRR